MMSITIRQLMEAFEDKDPDECIVAVETTRPDGSQQKLFLFGDETSMSFISGLPEPIQ